MTINLDEIEKALGEATPGPWFAHATDDSDFSNARYVSDREGPFVHDNKRSLTADRREDENIIAVTLWQRSPFIDEKDGREDANAHLIANAPEWLRLLVERVRKLEKVVSIIKDNPFTLSSWLDKELAVELGIAMLELEDKEAT